MCGRLAQVTDPEKIKAGLSALEVDEAVVERFRPHYNITPTQDILTVLNTPLPRLTFSHWGLIPSWAREKSTGSRMFNARSETLREKQSYREPFKRRRCIIFTDGFFEWDSVRKSRIPHFIRMKSGNPFALAGLWDHWIDKVTGNTVLSSTIITTDANELLARIHRRMPVILPDDQFRVWLSPEGAPEDMLCACLKPYPHDEMEAYEVSTLVNDPGIDSPDVIKRVQGLW
jgi:putative SOS response-associated peptidase YedK